MEDLFHRSLQPETQEWAGLFQQFRLGLMLWARTGKAPKAADQDLRDCLALQKKRLQQHDLELQLELSPDGPLYNLHNTVSPLGLLSDRLTGWA